MTPTNRCPYQEREILNTCALRFDGWQYIKDHQFDQRHAIRQFFETGMWQLSEHEQLAVFFLLQRGLCKWDLVYQPEHGKFWRAFRSLFFLVYDYKIPSDYALSQYVERWQRGFVPHLEECVSLIRQIHETIAYDNHALPEKG
jgi:hypothetical protein